LTNSELWNPKIKAFKEQEEEFEKQASSIDYNVTPGRHIYDIKTNDIQR
jgi:hypothetical protein